MLTIIFSVVFFLVIIMMLGCAHCLRAIYDVSDGRPSGALGRIKQSGLSKSKYGSSERKIPTVREPPTLEGAQLSRHKSVPSFPVIGHEDLQDMKMAHPLGDACYFSDAYSFSDTNPSPRESPLSTPRSTRMALHRMHSTGITLFQPSVEQISEGLPLHDNTRRHSVETFQSTLSNKLRGRGFPKRSVSVPDMAEQLEPKIEFDMAFSQETLTLFVENVKVTDLVIDQNRGYAYVNIDLLPASKAQRTTLWNVSSCLNFDERVCFENLSQTDLHKCMLLLTVFYTLSKGKRGTSLGEVLVNVSEQLDAAQSKVVVTRSLQIGRRQRKKSTSTNCLFRDLGNLFVLLQYQPRAGRIKVLVRKASHLPASGKLPGQPEHVVAIHLLRNGVKMSKKETKAQKGDCPTWNEPFLFDIPEVDMTQYSLEFVIMRGRIYTKDTVLGHVVIGPDSTRPGTIHWQDTIVPHGLEVAKWHAILPVLNYQY